MQAGATRLFAPLLIIGIIAFAWLKKYTFIPPALFLHYPYVTLGLSYILFRVLQLIIDRARPFRYSARQDQPGLLPELHVEFHHPGLRSYSTLQSVCFHATRSGPAAAEPVDCRPRAPSHHRRLFQSERALASPFDDPLQRAAFTSRRPIPAPGAYSRSLRPSRYIRFTSIAIFPAI